MNPIPHTDTTESGNNIRMMRISEWMVPSVYGILPTNLYLAVFSTSSFTLAISVIWWCAGRKNKITMADRVTSDYNTQTVARRSIFNMKPKYCPLPWLRVFYFISFSEFFMLCSRLFDICEARKFCVAVTDWVVNPECITFLFIHDAFCHLCVCVILRFVESAWMQSSEMVRRSFTTDELLWRDGHRDFSSSCPLSPSVLRMLIYVRRSLRCGCLCHSIIFWCRLSDGGRNIICTEYEMTHFLTRNS